METTGSSEILKAIYDNGSYLLLFGIRKYKVLKFPRNSFSYLKITASFF